MAGTHRPALAVGGGAGSAAIGRNVADRHRLAAVLVVVTVWGCSCPVDRWAHRTARNRNTLQIKLLLSSRYIYSVPLTEITQTMRSKNEVGTYFHLRQVPESVTRHNQISFCVITIMTLSHPEEINLGTKSREMAMKDIVRYRALGSLCRQHAAYNPAESWKLLAQAEHWEHQAQVETAAHFKECNGSTDDQLKSFAAA
jgi:hypothetical protein